jgi:hypothetical protein
MTVKFYKMPEAERESFKETLGTDKNVEKKALELKVIDSDIKKLNVANCKEILDEILANPTAEESNKKFTGKFTFDNSETFSQVLNKTDMQSYLTKIDKAITGDPKPNGIQSLLRLYKVLNFSLKREYGIEQRELVIEPSAATTSPTTALYKPTTAYTEEHEAAAETTTGYTPRDGLTQKEQNKIK